MPPGWDDWYGGVDPSTYDYYDYTINHNGTLRTYGRTPADYSTDVYAGLAEQAIRRPRGGQAVLHEPRPQRSAHRRARGPRPRRGHAGAAAAALRERFANAPMPRYPNFNEADLSDKPAIQAFFPNPLSVDDIASLRTTSAAGWAAARRRRPGRARRPGAEEDGEYKNTVIVFTSDNGWILGEHRLNDPVSEDGRATGVKYLPFEGSSRVPLIIAGPGFPARPHRARRGQQRRPGADHPGHRRRQATLPQDGISLLTAAQRPARLGAAAC